MAQQNWDDHDRSGCTIARDIAYNYLNSCDEDAVIFTNGDNDTFPLWYAQEVEGCRTDVRVCNLSYLQTEWYCDQMLRKAYESDPVPISFTHDQYTHDRDVVYLVDMQKGAMNLKDVINFVRSDDPRTKTLQGASGRVCFIPGHKFTLPVDSAAAIEGGAVSPADARLMAKAVNFSIPGNYILKNHLMVLDMLANSNWKRPLYYAVTVGRENYCGLDNYFRLEGLAQRIAPIYGSSDKMGMTGTVNTEKMYDNVMHKFRWGFYNAPGLYLDENKTRMGTNLRLHLTRLATALLDEAAGSPDSVLKRDRAVEVLDKIQYEVPAPAVPHNYFSLIMAEDYYRAAGDDCVAKGDEIVRDYAKDNWQELNFYLNLDDDKLQGSFDGVRRTMAIYYEILNSLSRAGRADLQKEVEAQYRDLELIATQLYK